MNGFLTTQVLDTALGRPARGLAIDLYKIEGETRHLVAEKVTNTDGRTDGPILPKQDFAFGTYELVFKAGHYLKETGRPASFLDQIPIRFSLSEDDHYHVPLLLSPFGYSTYRGS